MRHSNALAHTDRFSLLGQSLIRVREVNLFFFFLGEMFNLLVHMLYRWASGMKSPFPVPSSEPSGILCLNLGTRDYRA